MAGPEDLPKSSHDDAYWRDLLLGESRSLTTFSKTLRRFPSAPRCKLCQAPFAGPFAPVFRLLGFRRWGLNQQMCRFCVTDLEKHGGGAEIPVSVLYADVRGSTALAESLAPAEFTKQLGHFYKSSAKAIDAQLGVIDHIAGDGVMAMWIPAFVRGDHPQRAVAAGRAMAKELATDESVHVGVGVHTGEAYVGVVGETGSRDFTVLGDVANTVARLGSEAGPGELMMSDAIATAAGVVTEHLEHRALELKGKAQPFGTWVERVGSIVPGN